MADAGGKKPLKQSTLMLFGLPEYAVYLGSIPVSWNSPTWV
jgi:hypothetical protein